MTLTLSLDFSNEFKKKYTILKVLLETRLTGKESILINLNVKYSAI